MLLFNRKKFLIPTGGRNIFIYLFKSLKYQYDYNKDLKNLLLSMIWLYYTRQFFLWSNIVIKMIIVMHV